MALRRPTPAYVLMLAVSTVVYVLLPVLAWGWDDWRGLLAHPARVGVGLVLIVAVMVSVFAPISPAGFLQRDTRGVWLLAPISLAVLALTLLPPYCDRRGLWTLDGDAVRYLGLALFTVGAVLRIGPIFALAGRFTWPLASHGDDHRLVTTGFYRYIRHPSYLGFLLAMLGWVLVFRSGVGLLVFLLFTPLIFVIIPAEEALLLAEFGEEYDSYQRRTWRLLPFLY
jgi:protein-S-isoprenylcysteine O-methyltransferase Ste14